MAQNVTTAFVTLFESEVKQAYQSESILRGTMRTRTGVQGNTVKFPKIGKGVATPRINQTDVTPLNVTYSQVTANMSDFIAAEYSDIFHQTHINFDERRELVEVVSKAIARRMDQICIDALDAAASPSTVATSIGGAASNMNIEKLRATAKAMNEKNVPSEGRYLLMHASQLDALLGETEITSADFASVKALVRGEISSFMGFQVLTMGDRDEGGVPKPSTRTCFAWHKDSLGYAESMAQKTEVNYIAEKTSFLVSSMFSAGAVAIDDEGIVKISCTE
ncbi:phage capsid protein [Alphaproteobacteria bacterium]|jgi:N4-gp56 family major capsid protein|nr:phage capsid protein [Alphaproteobacteria bacterium]